MLHFVHFSAIFIYKTLYNNNNNNLSNNPYKEPLYLLLFMHSKSQMCDIKYKRNLKWAIHNIQFNFASTSLKALHQSRFSLL